MSETARCPACSSEQAVPVGWTIWGGVIGPKMLSHVKCVSCGKTFNGKTGKSNLVPIIIYQVVAIAVSLVLVAALYRYGLGSL